MIKIVDLHAIIDNEALGIEDAGTLTQQKHAGFGDFFGLDSFIAHVPQDKRESRECCDC
jgi:hypothetical protein